MIRQPVRRRLLPAMAALAALAACAPEPPPARMAPPATLPQISAAYGPVQDGSILIPAIPPQYLTQQTIRRQVEYWTDAAPGTIIVDPFARYLYFVEPGNRATRYAVAVGREGRGFSGSAVIPIKREWPRWIPTQNMIAEDPGQYARWAEGMDGGLHNPLGARALYLHRDGRDTYYRIHGTNEPSSIGNATSAGCIRLFNQDILHLYDRVGPGTPVVVLTEAQSGRGTLPTVSTMPPLALGADGLGSRFESEPGVFLIQPL